MSGKYKHTVPIFKNAVKNKREAEAERKKVRERKIVEGE